MSLLRSAIPKVVHSEPLQGPSRSWASRWPRKAVAACIFLLATIPLFGQTAPVSDDKARLGSIHRTLTTSQADASGGLAGISIQLVKQPAAGSPATADTDDAGHYEFKDVKPGSYTISVSQAGFAAFSNPVPGTPAEAINVTIPLTPQTAP